MPSGEAVLKDSPFFIYTPIEISKTFLYVIYTVFSEIVSNLVRNFDSEKSHISIMLR